MNEVTAQQPLEPPRTQEELTAEQNVLLDRAAGEMAALRSTIDTAVMNQGQLIEFMAGLRRLADFQGELRDLRAEGRKRLARGTLGQAWEILQPELVADAAPEPERPRRSRHAAPRAPGERRVLRALRVLIPAAAAAFAAKAWAARKAVGLSLAALATVPAGGAVVQVVQSAPPAHAAPGQVPAPVASPWSAVPAVTPSRVPAVKPAAATSSPLPAPVAPVPPPSSSSSAPAPASQSAGVLVADSTALNLGILGRGSVTITATGGPVSWTAPQVPGLDISPASGELEAGQSVTVTFTADDQSHSGFAIADLGGADISVSWPAVAGLVQGVVSSLLS